MERYGCLVIGVIIALVLLFGIVYLWSGWLNRPVGRAPAAATAALLPASLPAMDRGLAPNPPLAAAHGELVEPSIPDAGANDYSPLHPFPRMVSRSNHPSRTRGE